MKHRSLFFGIVLSLFMIAALCGCHGQTVTQIASINSFIKMYLEGSEEYSTSSIDLTKYVAANGAPVEYTVTSEDPSVAVASVNGDTLAVTMKSGEGSSRISVDVLSDGTHAFTLSFTVTAAPCRRIACVGDSLTYGHAWPTESYPVYLQRLLGEDVSVRNFGVNGSAVTDRSDPSFTLKYDTLPVYEQSITFRPDVVFLMLGSNDGFNWAGSEPTFEQEYRKLIDDYFACDAYEVIVMTAPPTLAVNQFNLPNDIIRDKVCPIQRAVAADLSLPILDMRTILEAQEDMESFYRPGDGVHFSVKGAQFVAETAADLFKIL